MGISTFPNVASPIKSIQRGVAAAAGNITITAVVVAKTTTRSFSTGSAGTVAATGTVAASNGSTSGMSSSSFSSTGLLSANSPQTFNTAAVINIPSTGATTSYYNYSARYGSIGPYYGGAATVDTISAFNTNGMNISMNNQAISGGTTDLATVNYGVYLQDSTTLVATGPCRYEVVEHY
jgi:hypothetical protein